MDARKGDALEIDELCIRQKGSLWLWMVRSRKNGQILAAVMGNRSGAMLERLWHKVPHSYRRKLVYTDGYEVYALFFPAQMTTSSSSTESATSVTAGPVESREPTRCFGRACPDWFAAPAAFAPSAFWMSGSGSCSSSTSTTESVSSNRSEKNANR